MSSSVTCPWPLVLEAAAQVQDEEVQGQVGVQAADAVGLHGPLHVRDEHGVHGLFVAEAGEVVERPALAGLEIRVLRVQEAQAGEASFRMRRSFWKTRELRRS